MKRDEQVPWSHVGRRRWFFPMEKASVLDWSIYNERVVVSPFVYSLLRSMAFAPSEKNLPVFISD